MSIHGTSTSPNANSPTTGRLAGHLVCPHRLADTVEALHNAQADHGLDPAAVAAEQVIHDCDTKLTRYREALEAGTDPTLIAHWTTEIQARRAQALAHTRQATATRRMSKEEIRSLIETLGNTRAVLADAAPVDKAPVYHQLGLHLTYEPPNDSSEPKPASTCTVGVMVCVRGGTCTLTTRLLLPGDK